MANLVSQGRFEHLKELNLSDEGGVSDQGIYLLAQAIDVHGLPALETFKLECSNEGITMLGIDAIAQAVINGCPQLRKIYLWDYEQDEDNSFSRVNEMVEGILRVAGFLARCPGWHNHWRAAERRVETRTEKRTASGVT